MTYTGRNTLVSDVYRMRGVMYTGRTNVGLIRPLTYTERTGQGSIWEIPVSDLYRMRGVTYTERTGVGLIDRRAVSDVYRRTGVGPIQRDWSGTYTGGDTRTQSYQ